MCSFSLSTLFVSGAGATKTPAVPGGLGVFVAPCVSWRQSRLSIRTSAWTSTPRFSSVFSGLGVFSGLVAAGFSAFFLA